MWRTRLGLDALHFFGYYQNLTTCSYKDMKKLSIIGLLVAGLLLTGAGCSLGSLWPFSSAQNGGAISGGISSDTLPNNVSNVSSSVAIVPKTAVQSVTLSVPTSLQNVYTKDLKLSFQLPQSAIVDEVDGFTPCDFAKNPFARCSGSPESGHYILVGNVQEDWSSVVEIFVEEPTSTPLVTDKIFRTGYGKAITFLPTADYFKKVLAPYTPAVDWLKVNHYAAIVEPGYLKRPPLAIFATTEGNFSRQDFEKLLYSIRLK